MKEKSSIEQIAQKIKASKSVAIFTHMRPDGDALGASLALSFALDFLGIENVVCDESVLPSNLSFLPDLNRVKKQPQPNADLYIALDSADSARLGELQNVFLKGEKKGILTINIDHHISNPSYAKMNYVRECSANCMNVARLIETLGVPLNKKIAEYLLTGLLTDSGNFSHEDVDEECFLLAAKLVKAGADIRGFTYNLFKKQPKQRAALHAEVMKGIRYFHDDKFALISIALETMEKHGADNGMTEGFVDFPLSVDTVEVAASIMEVKKGQYKISLRSKTYADVNGIAKVYGGGGHVRAAGCMLFGELEEVVDKLSYTVSQYL